LLSGFIALVDALKLPLEFVDVAIVTPLCVIGEETVENVGSEVVVAI
jgi:hypothetical protein